MYIYEKIQIYIDYLENLINEIKYNKNSKKERQDELLNCYEKIRSLFPNIEVEFKPDISYSMDLLYIIKDDVEYKDFIERQNKSVDFMTGKNINMFNNFVEGSKDNELYRKQSEINNLENLINKLKKIEYYEECNSYDFFNFQKKIFKLFPDIKDELKLDYFDIVFDSEILLEKLDLYIKKDEDKYNRFLKFEMEKYLKDFKYELLKIKSLLENYKDNDLISRIEKINECIESNDIYNIIDRIDDLNNNIPDKEEIKKSLNSYQKNFKRYKYL